MQEILRFFRPRSALLWVILSSYLLKSCLLGMVHDIQFILNGACKIQNIGHHNFKTQRVRLKFLHITYVHVQCPKSIDRLMQIPLIHPVIYTNYWIVSEFLGLRHKSCSKTLNEIQICSVTFASQSTRLR